MALLRDARERPAVEGDLEQYDVAPDWAIHHILQHEAEHRSHIAWLRDTYKPDRGVDRA